jgi:Raf kinase inhibitor-like YbhB/YbcL family protein
MKITSSAFNYNEKIPSVYTCDGKNISPPLSFAEIPKEAKSLALVVDDLDAPSGLWVHWIVYNISPTTSGIPKNTTPDGAHEMVNDFKKKSYGGPCPQNGTHRYFFRLYALDVEHLQDVTKNNFHYLCKKHAISEATLMGTYRKK